jgi:hypothetical protein
MLFLVIFILPGIVEYDETKQGKRDSVLGPLFLNRTAKKLESLLPEE